MTDLTFTNPMLWGLLAMTVLSYLTRWGILLCIAGLGIMIYGFTLSDDNLAFSILTVVFGGCTIVYGCMKK